MTNTTQELTPQTLTITQPDDWHIHLRDAAILGSTVDAVGETFGRVIVMPNLAPPVVNVELAQQYHQRILAAGAKFNPLMTLYLTDHTTAQDIEQIKQSDFVHAVKLYPSGATTNSTFGVSSIKERYSVFEAMQKQRVPLLVHSEVVDDDIDIFDREAVFIERYLHDIVKQFPELNIVLEHVTTSDGVDFVKSQSNKVAATITPQHLLFNRNHLLVGGIKPHFYCLPVLKRDIHQHSLIEAATSGNAQFFLGSDSAPHAKHLKEAACGCAGCYSAHFTIELYALAFERANALDKLEAFASFNGADFYGLPRNNKTIKLIRQPQQLPEQLTLGEGVVVPLMAGCELPWTHKPC